MKKLIICIALFACGNFGVAQTYMTAVGVRLGNTAGISVNQRVLKKWSVEGIVQNDFRNNTYITGLAKRHVAVFARGANFYFGGGVHSGFSGTEGRVAHGFDGVFGLEVTMMRLNFSLDYKPSINTSGAPFYSGHSALSVRYVIAKTGSKQRQRWRENKKKRRQKGKIKGKQNSKIRLPWN